MSSLDITCDNCEIPGIDRKSSRGNAIARRLMLDVGKRPAAKRTHLKSAWKLNVDVNFDVRRATTMLGPNDYYK